MNTPTPSELLSGDSAGAPRGNLEQTEPNNYSSTAVGKLPAVPLATATKLG